MGKYTSEITAKTTFKLVCKQCKSLAESPCFRQRFLSYHQNSHSSWSLMYIHSPEEVVGYYACKIWGLPRTLGFYISSLIREKFEYEFHHQRQRVKVEAYTRCHD
ncbi:hypothetical protein ARALYDRAFT_906165 [Arabidopsis lyrata subsp. lyrata]|uniref:F-box protein At3g26010-like beta-propeller domain-containing protein n=1 Tax=Arabidopsis lyrata subsp. lyrata TaxID=81972 RepID=D7LS40_ARALL|nr:hypothetical protein ARALYDRAFT_906165 [Arabidopsis lyrata subsp. lyrata]